MRARNIMIQTGTGMLGLMLFAGAAWSECAAGDASKAAVSQFVVRSGEVYDRQTNLTWQRCSVGQRWLESGGYAGTPSKLKFDDAQALEPVRGAFPTWRN